MHLLLLVQGGEGLAPQGETGEKKDNGGDGSAPNARATVARCCRRDPGGYTATTKRPLPHAAFEPAPPHIMMGIKASVTQVCLFVLRAAAPSLSSSGRRASGGQRKDDDDALRSATVCMVRHLHNNHKKQNPCGRRNTVEPCCWLRALLCLINSFVFRSEIVGDWFLLHFYK
jgi:hypothetical protein